MKTCAISSNRHARASWPLPDPTLAYFPNARFATSDRDLGAGAFTGGGAVPEDFGHVPVLADRCVDLLTPALTRRSADGTGAVLVDATLGAGGHAERFLTDLPGLRLIGLDRDPDALWAAGERLAPFADHAPATTRSPAFLPNPVGSTENPGSTACCSTSGCRPCNWTGPNVASHMPPTRR
jgi:16S rRNA (cytosine1402-N4)-methyltransferase